jgi:hypothetical protein
MQSKCQDKRAKNCQLKKLVIFETRFKTGGNFAKPVYYRFTRENYTEIRVRAAG